VRNKFKFANNDATANLALGQESKIKKETRLEVEAVHRNKEAKGCRLNCLKFLRCLCRFKDYNDLYEPEEVPSCFNTCCWSFFRSRQNAYLFNTSKVVRKY